MQQIKHILASVRKTAYELFICSLVRVINSANCCSLLREGARPFFKRIALIYILIPGAD